MTTNPESTLPEGSNDPTDIGEAAGTPDEDTDPQEPDPPSPTTPDESESTSDDELGKAASNEPADPDGPDDRAV